MISRESDSNEIEDDVEDILKLLLFQIIIRKVMKMSPLLIDQLMKECGTQFLVEEMPPIS